MDEDWTLTTSAENDDLGRSILYSHPSRVGLITITSPSLRSTDSESVLDLKAFTSSLWKPSVVETFVPSPDLNFFTSFPSRSTVDLTPWFTTVSARFMVILQRVLLIASPPYGLMTAPPEFML